MKEHRFVAIDDRGAVVGWVAVTPVSDRPSMPASSSTPSTSTEFPWPRVGRALLDALVASTEPAGIWTIQSGVFPENHASIALHLSAGFRVVGTRNGSVSIRASGVTLC